MRIASWKRHARDMATTQRTYMSSVSGSSRKYERLNNSQQDPAALGVLPHGRRIGH